MIRRDLCGAGRCTGRTNQNSFGSYGMLRHFRRMTPQLSARHRTAPRGAAKRRKGHGQSHYKFTILTPQKCRMTPQVSAQTRGDGRRLTDPSLGGAGCSVNVSL